MKANPKCKVCKISLKPNHFKNQTWYGCPQCTASFVPVNTFSTILTEYEFNKFKNEIRKAQIKSSDQCPACTKPMVKIIDLVEKNQVEVCSACQLVWLDPHEGAKIKADQDQLQNSDKKISLVSNKFFLHEVQSYANDGKYYRGYGYGHDSINHRLLRQDIKISLYNRLINAILDFFGFHEKTKNNSFAAAVVSLIILTALAWFFLRYTHFGFTLFRRIVPIPSWF